MVLKYWVGFHSMVPWKMLYSICSVVMMYVCRDRPEADISCLGCQVSVRVDLYTVIQ